MTKRIESEQITQELLRVSELLGHAPSFEEMRTHGSVSPSTCLKRFGPTWEFVKRSIGWKPRWESFDFSSVNPIDAAWICGLIDGEGCFRIQSPSPNGGNGLSKSYSPVFCMSLRDDDKPLLEKFLTIIGCYDDVRIDNFNVRHNNGNPMVKISIRDVVRLNYHLLPIIDLYGLNSKKKYELPWFKLAVSVIINKKISGRTNFGYTDKERNILSECTLYLHKLKVYGANVQEISNRYNDIITTL